MSSHTEESEVIKIVQTPSLGKRLQEAREGLNLSIEDVSNRLRLSSRQIKSLEADDFATLPDAMITRGFIRNYARLLEIDAEPLLEAYRAYVPSEPPRAITLQSENILISGNDNRAWVMYLSIAALAVVLLGVWLYVDSTSLPSSGGPVAAAPEEKQEETAAPAANTGPAESMPIPALPAAERMDDSTYNSGEAGENADTADITGAIPASGASQAAAAPPVSAVAMTKARFVFSESSWISVTDGNGNEIVNKHKPSGSEELVEGKPPLKVVIGNAAGTRLVFNDKPVELAPHTRLNVARLTLE